MIPSSKPPKKALPPPFQRPRIEIGATKREWKWVLPSEIHKGDIVPDFGLIEEDVQNITADDVPVLAFLMGKGKSDYLPADIRIWAFT